MNTGEMLDELAKVGKPRLSRQDTGWFAAVELPAPAGVQAVVRSDFSHPTHRSALTQLLARVGELRPVAPRAGASLIDGTVVGPGPSSTAVDDQLTPDPNGDANA